MVFFAAAFVLAGLMTWGLLASRKQRSVDQQHLAAFIGFIAAVIAVAGIVYILGEAAMLRHLSPSTMNPIFQVFNAVVSVIFFGALVVTFVAGLFSRGIHRVALISCSVVVSLMLLFTIAAHFGD